MIYFYLFTKQRRRDEAQIGTAYTSVFDENLSEYFSRCFD